MKKIIILAVLGAVIVGGYFVFQTTADAPGMTVETNAEEQITNLAEEVLAIEEELAQLDVKVKNGTLTAAEATTAQAVLTTRLASVTTALTASDSISITTEQQAAMVATLETIKLVLIRYQDTLVAVDTIVEQDYVSKGKRGFPGSITKAFVATVEDFTEQVDDTVQGYIPSDVALDADTAAHLDDVDEATEVAETPSDVDAEMEGDIDIMENDTNVEMEAEEEGDMEVLPELQ